MRVCTSISVLQLRRALKKRGLVSVLVNSASLYINMSMSNQHYTACFLLDSLGVVAVKNLPHSNMFSVLSTSFDDVDHVLDKMLPKQDAGGDNVSLFYLLDFNGFVVWTSDAEQLQVGGHQFAELQPLVFEDMVNNSVFIMGRFMGYEPKPCGAPQSVTTACSMDSAASSLHKVC